MGRSNSCFKIITCAGADSSDDVEAPEVKGDKKGWSFRKRSARHRVLSNTAVSETSTPPNAKKEAPESANISFQTPITSDVPEKVFDVPEKVPDVPEKVPDVPEKVPDVPEEVPDVPENVPDVRGNIPDVQANVPDVRGIVLENVPDVRGNVPENVPDVRGNVPETVPDVQENVPEEVSYVNETVVVRESAEEKLQVLSSEDSMPANPDPVLDDVSEVVDSEVEESAAALIQTAVRAFLGQRELENLKKVIKLQAAVRGHLVRNHAVGALRCVQAIVKMQVLVRARQARISASVDESGPNQKQDKDNAKNRPSPTYISIDKLLSNRFARQLLDSTPKEKPIHMKCEISQTNSAWNWFERWMSASTTAPSPQPSPASETVPHQQTSDNISSHEAENEDLPITLSKSVDLPSSVTEPSVGDDDIVVTDSIEIRESQSENVGTSDSPFVFSSVSIQTVVLSESPEVGGKDETEEPKRSMKRSASDELENDLKKSTFGSSNKPINPGFLSAQSSFEEMTSNLNEEKPETECGTELSISSTLDSPDHYNSGVAEIENDKLEIVNNSTLLDVTDEAVDSSTVAAKTEESHDQEVKPDIIETSQQESSYVASPERSMSILESQGTPASQASVNTAKGSKRGPTHKQKSLSANKASPSHLYNDSGSSSTKQSGKDEKSGKRRGATKSENVGEQEGRDSSSVPHFMQATQSAKAKISANSSPRSSPDVQDREGHVKKRLSLPGANGRQASPRIQRSTSQPVPIPKAIGVPVQERKWLR